MKKPVSAKPAAALPGLPSSAAAEEAPKGETVEALRAKLTGQGARLAVLERRYGAAISDAIGLESVNAILVGEKKALQSRVEILEAQLAKAEEALGTRPPAAPPE